MKQVFLVTLLAVISCRLHAQLQLNGKVVNQRNAPIAGATVVLKNVQTSKTYSLLTQEDGNFSVKEIPENAVCRLQVTGVGFEVWEHTLTFKTSRRLKIALIEKAAELEPLEVSAIRAGDHAPFAKTNIAAAGIKKQNLGRDLPYVLDQTPNVVVNSDAGNGIGYTGIHIRGSDASRTNVTINGIPYNDAESSGSYFVDLPDVISSVGSIQVQRGVGTSSNGAGAFGATINLSTNELHEKPYAELNNSYGSYNTWKNTVLAGSGLIDGKFTADVRLSNISSDGYIDRASSKLQSLYFSTAYIGKKTTVRFNLITGKEKTYQAWNGVPADSIHTHRTYNELGKMNDAAVYNDTDYYKNQTDNYIQTHYQLFLTHRFNDKWSFNLSSFLTRGNGYYEEYKRDADYAAYGIPYPEPVPGVPVTSTDLVRRKYLDNHFYGQTFSLQYRAEKDMLTLGGSWTNYDGGHYGNVVWAKNGGIINDYKYYNLPAFKYDKNVYLKWMHHFAQYWYLFADVQYRNVWHKMNGFEDAPSAVIKRNFDFVNPKLGISFERNGYNAYASYAMANKEPNRDDFEAGITDPPKAERLNDVELGVEKQDAQYHWAVNLYYMGYKDQLVVTGKLNDVGSAMRINVLKSYRAGVELQGGYVFANWLNATANLSVSRNKIDRFTAYFGAYDADWNPLPQQSKDYTKTDIAFSPNVVGAGTINIIPCKNLEIALISKYVGKQYLDNTQDAARMLKSYYNQDVRIMYTIKNKLFKEWSITGQVYNVFNHLYNSGGATYPEYDNGKLENYIYYFPMAPVNCMIGLNIKL